MEKQRAYFESRADLGRQIADELSDLEGSDIAILALSEGALAIAIEIAKKVHAIVGMLPLKAIKLPGEDRKIGVINDNGVFTYNLNITKGEAEELEIEYRGSIETSKSGALHQLHLSDAKQFLSPHFFSDKIVIMVQDVTVTGTSYQAAMDFLKPIRIQSVILVAGIANVGAIDIMHRIGDRLVISHPTDKDFPASHYFEDNETLMSEEITNLQNQVVLKW